MPTKNVSGGGLTRSYNSSPCPRSPQMMPSSVLANQSQNRPVPECCCFSVRFVNLVLFLFNFIFLLSGICILLLTLLYGRPEVNRYLGETTKYLNNIISLLGNGHLVQIIHYSMLFCGIIIIIISLMNIVFSTATSWSRSSDYYYYHRRKKKQMNENEALLHYNTGGNGNNGSIFDSTIERPHSTTYLNDLIEENRASNESSKNSLPSSSSLSSNSNHHDHFHGRNEECKQQQPLTTEHQRQQCQLKNGGSIWSNFGNSTVVLCCYIFILLFLFTVQLVIGLLSVIMVSPEHVFISSRTVHNDDFLVSIRESVDFHELLVNRADEIESLYSAFHCCGWNAFEDYEYLQDINHRNKSAPVPDACCKTWVKNCGHRKHPNNIYYDGCWSKFGAEMRDYVLMLGWTALGFAVIELIGLMFAVCHYVQILSKNT